MMTMFPGLRLLMKVHVDPAGSVAAVALPSATQSHGGGDAFLAAVVL